MKIVTSDRVGCDVALQEATFELQSFSFGALKKPPGRRLRVGISLAGEPRSMPMVWRGIQRNAP